MKVRVDINRLKEIEETTKLLRRKNGGWRSQRVLIHGRQKLQVAFVEYTNYWIRLISGLFPEFDPKKYYIRMTAIEVSLEVDNIIANILYGLNYVEYSPVRNDKLKNNECIIHEDKVLVRRSDFDDRKL